jgi:hypothetical protein
MKNSNKGIPLARNKGLVVQKLAEEVVVYDTDSQKAHCLNPSAALIWEHCDGKRTVRELSHLLEGDQRGKEEMVWIALDQLEKSDLLQQPIKRPNALAGMNRRQMLKAAGIAAMIAVPVVSTIVAPKAAQAVTCLATGQGCTISAQCCSGLCNLGTCA